MFLSINNKIGIGKLLTSHNLYYNKPSFDDNIDRVIDFFKTYTLAGRVRIQELMNPISQSNQSQNKEKILFSFLDEINSTLYVRGVYHISFESLDDCMMFILAMDSKIEKTHYTSNNRILNLANYNSFMGGYDNKIIKEFGISSEKYFGLYSKRLENKKPYRDYSRLSIPSTPILNYYYNVMLYLSCCLEDKDVLITNRVIPKEKIYFIFKDREVMIHIIEAMESIGYHMGTAVEVHWGKQEE